MKDIQETENGHLSPRGYDHRLTFNLPSLEGKNNQKVSFIIPK